MSCPYNDIQVAIFLRDEFDRWIQEKEKKHGPCPVELKTQLKALFYGHYLKSKFTKELVVVDDELCYFKWEWSFQLYRSRQPKHTCRLLHRFLSQKLRRKYKNWHSKKAKK
jgi:hypothetical protein